MSSLPGTRRSRASSRAHSAPPGGTASPIRFEHYDPPPQEQNTNRQRETRNTRSSRAGSQTRSRSTSQNRNRQDTNEQSQNQNTTPNDNTAEDNTSTGAIPKVKIKMPLYSQQEIDEAVEYIKNHPNGEAYMPFLRRYVETSGNDFDIVDFANRLRDSTEKAKAKANNYREELPLPSAPIYDAALAQRIQYLKPEKPDADPLDQAKMQEMRKALLGLELQDRTIQRRLIDPPQHFAPGQSSIRENETIRMEKIKLYFPLSFSGKKFTGKKGSEISILNLLQDMNNAQQEMNVTELEFVQFLTKAMSGEAHATMMNYLDLFRRKQMSLADIYLSLTDLYFTDMRPAAALEKLQSITEFNHQYTSMSEAHNGILFLANLASLSSRKQERQDALCAGYYQQALIRIIPREYKAMSIATIENCGNLKNEDLSPHEILACLNKMRHPIDDALRKTANRDRNKNPGQQSYAATRKQIKLLEAQLPKKENSSTGKKGANSTKKSGKTSEVKVINQSTNKPERDTRNNTPKHTQQNSDADNRKRSCPLCGIVGHPAENCYKYTPEQRRIAPYACRECKCDLHHFERWCHKKASGSKN